MMEPLSGENARCLLVTLLFVIIETLHGFPQIKQGLPICTSHNSLCDVKFDISSMPFIEATEPMCQCPGLASCPTAKDDPRRTYTQELISSGEKITTTLSFCDVMSVPTRTCKENEVAVTLRGMGPIIYDIVGDVTCHCPKPLTLYKAVPDGPFSLRSYTCGKPACNVNKSAPPVCERVSGYQFGYGLESELPCTCPDNYFCMVDSNQIPIFGGEVEFFCQPEHY